MNECGKATSHRDVMRLATLDQMNDDRDSRVQPSVRRLRNYLSNTSVARTDSDCTRRLISVHSRPHRSTAHADAAYC